MGKESQTHVCKALSDSHGSFRPSLAEVEALLGDDWGPPLHARVPGPLAQQYEFEARHFRDLTSESYVTDCAPGGGDSAGPRTPTTPPPPRGLRPTVSCQRYEPKEPTGAEGAPAPKAPSGVM